MIARAIAASVPFRWVAGDTVYGVGDIEQQLRRAGKGYVLGVSSAHVFRSWGKRRSVAGKAEDIARAQHASDWKRLSAGTGTKGPRLHDWCYLELADLETEASNDTNESLWTRGLLVRRPSVVPITTSEFPTPATRPAFSVLDCHHLQSTFGITLPDWHDALGDVLNEMKTARA
jgi:SRSO17 transposase